MDQNENLLSEYEFDLNQINSDWDSIGQEYSQPIPRDKPLSKKHRDFVESQGIHFHNSLGKGGFGEVFRCTRKTSQKDSSSNQIIEELAVKISTLSRFKLNYTVKEAVEELFKEYDTHNKLHHKNIVKSMGMFRVPDLKSKFPVIHVLQLMELCGGDLKSMIRNKPDRKMSEPEAHEWFIQVIEGLKYLHDNNVAHLDIKASNILYSRTEPLIYKLTDFGISKKFDPTEVIQSSDEDLILPSDSSLEMTAFRLKSSDILCLGVTLAKSLTGFPLMASTVLTHNDILMACRHWSPETQSTFGISQRLADLLTLMVNKPEIQINIQQIIDNKWCKTTPKPQKWCNVM